MSTEPAIEVHNLTVNQAGQPVLWSLDFAVPQGRMAALLGPNGAGKTTLLKAMLGILPITAGEVRFLGKPQIAMRGYLAYVPQRSEVDWDFPVTVEEVVLMGRAAHISAYSRPGKRDKEIALHSLVKLGMGDFRKRPIGKLSGGQQQRVFIARALAQEANIILLDEPFAGVDATSEKAIVTILKELKNEGKTIFCVHHDLQSVKEYFDWAVLINQRLVASGATQTVLVKEHLQHAYGARLDILSELSSSWKEQEFTTSSHD